jgi:hypothetical protein
LKKPKAMMTEIIVKVIRNTQIHQTGKAKATSAAETKATQTQATTETKVPPRNNFPLKLKIILPPSNASLTRFSNPMFLTA